MPPKKKTPQPDPFQVPADLGRTRRSAQKDVQNVETGYPSKRFKVDPKNKNLVEVSNDSDPKLHVGSDAINQKFESMQSKKKVYQKIHAKNE